MPERQSSTMADRVSDLNRHVHAVLTGHLGVVEESRASREATFRSAP
jgi:hypothetical protein